MVSRSSVQTTELEAETAHSKEVRVVSMQLRPQHKVQWTDDTVDNEHMNKRKSKSESCAD